MPTPIGFGPVEPASWALTWQGHKGGSDDPAATMTEGKKPAPTPPTSPSPQAGGQITVGPMAAGAWPNGFIDSTGTGYPAWFGPPEE